MRDLVLMRGAPASGKTTFLANNGLLDYAIVADQVRLLVRSPETTVSGGLAISQKRDGLVWQIILDLLEERMKRGEFTIIDATHSKPELITAYRKLVEQYRYRTYVLEMETTLEECLERNSSRGLRQVPDEVIKNFYARIETNPLPKWATKITSEELKTLLEFQPIDWSKYNKIHHIGDIHGCYTALSNYIGEIKEDELYIFCGDYFNRGTEDTKVFRFLMDNLDKKNVILLQGNHEVGLQKWAFAERRRDSFNETEIEFEENDISPEDGRELFRRLSQIAYYKYGDKVVCVTHGGIPLPPTRLMATDEFVFGVGKYENTAEIYECWNAKTDENYFQIHGHRNVLDHPMQNGRCFNLDSRVEFGENLRCVVLNKDGFECIETPNPVFRQRIVRPHMSVSESDVVKALRASEFIKEVPQFGDISSFNFTREAFMKDKWNDETIKARGLFLDVSTGKVVARAYDKFFNLNERRIKTNNLRDKLQFPVEVFVKENGYLGIVGTYNGNAVVTTKSSTSGNYVDMFNSLLPNSVKEYAVKHNKSLVFEVICPTKDPHIIEYPNDKIVLLDVVDLDLEYRAIPYEELVEIGKLLGVEVKQRIATINDADALLTLIKEMESYDFTFNGNPIEGVVVYDSVGQMLKVKSQFYNFWKQMRRVLEKVSRRQQVAQGQFTTAHHTKVFGFMKSLLSVDGMSIIDIRNQYEHQ